MPRNEATIASAFERAMQGESVFGDEYLLTGIRSCAVPEKSMPLDEARAVLKKFFPETVQGKE